MGYYLDMWILPHRVEMLDHIESEDQYILLLYPRDHLKTSSVTGFLIKKLLYNPWLRVLAVSNTKELALQNVGAIKAPMENNPKILRDFGNVRGEPWGNEKFTLNRPPSPGKEPSCIARSLGASALGMHFDIIWCDDIVTTETQWTEDQRKKVWAWFTGTLLRCLDRHGKLIVTGTRKHIDDLYHQLLTSEGWQSHVYKAIIEEERRAVLAPWLYDYDRLTAERRRMGHLMFAQEMQNEPVALEGLALRKEWLRYYDIDSTPKFAHYYMGIDPAVGKSDIADYTAVVLLGVTSALHYYVLDIHRARVPIGWVSYIVDLWTGYCNRGWRPSVVGVEAVMTQRMQARELREAATAMPVKFVEYRTMDFEGQLAKDKIARLQAMGVLFEKGQIFLPNPDQYPMTRTFEHEEYLQFPEGEHDDMLDALAIALIVSPLTGAGPSFRSG